MHNGTNKKKMVKNLGSVIVRLGIDSKNLKKGLTKAQRQLRTSGREMKAIGDSMTMAFTVPFAAIVVGSAKLVRPGVIAIAISNRNTGTLLELYSGLGSFSRVAFIDGKKLSFDVLKIESFFVFTFGFEECNLLLIGLI